MFRLLYGIISHNVDKALGPFYCDLLHCLWPEQSLLQEEARCPTASSSEQLSRWAELELGQEVEEELQSHYKWDQCQIIAQNPPPPSQNVYNHGFIYSDRMTAQPVSKLRFLLEQKLGGLDGRTKRRTAMKMATVASVTYLSGGVRRGFTNTVISKF